LKTNFLKLREGRRERLGKMPDRGGVQVKANAQAARGKGCEGGRKLPTVRVNVNGEGENWGKKKNQTRETNSKPFRHPWVQRRISSTEGMVERLEDLKNEKVLGGGKRPRCFFEGQLKRAPRGKTRKGGLAIRSWGKKKRSMGKEVSNSANLSQSCEGKGLGGGKKSPGAQGGL